MLFNTTKKIHFIGIGGISMSAMAAILHARGHHITGSDATNSDQTKMLQDIGIMTNIPHKKLPSCDIVVVNAAISKSNKELRQVKSQKIITREQLLAEMSKSFETVIAVAGTHGKSTTVAMIHQILIEANLNPTTHNGAVMLNNNSNYHIGDNKIFLTEACEFKKSFLTLKPTIAVITNIDADHMDCYDGLKEICETFKSFANQSALVIKNQKCINSKDILGKKFSPYPYKLQVHGIHNQQNAQAAATVGQLLGVDNKIIRRALRNFKGIERRFHKIDQIENCDIIWDYAHHPTAIRATIDIAKKVHSKFLIIFQPHTYTRTKALFNDFLCVLKDHDVIMYKTYAAREKPRQGKSAKDLAKTLNCDYISNA
ncbi:MAG: Mur ligase domain-containing protein, partial [Bacteroidales bacterium]|nr:Mur ligase domain-containing protein [Bacteroidales bacterium]